MVVHKHLFGIGVGKRNRVVTLVSLFDGYEIALEAWDIQYTSKKIATAEVVTDFHITNALYHEFGPITDLDKMTVGAFDRAE